MECFGISENDGTIYEGDLRHGFRPVVQPLIVPIKFPAFTLTTWDPKAVKYSPVLFREDFFDPITKIRRGRVFVMRDTSQPHTWTVHDPFRPRPQLNILNREERVHFYERSSLSPLREAPLHPTNHIAIIGEEPFVSFWKIVGVETSVYATPILTLKSYRSLGDLPELDIDRVPKDILPELEEGLEKVAASNHRAGAIGVVDRCRDTLALIIGYLAGDRSLDLMPAAQKLLHLKPPRHLIHHAASVTARMHSRGKSNEQHNYSTRPVSEEDAQLTIGCLSLVLKEIGWAKT